MKRVLSITLSSLVLLAFALPVSAQPPWGPPRGTWRDRPVPAVPNLNGTWYNQGDPGQPTEIRQRGPDGTAIFINENGSRARGEIRGNRVFIPDWSDGHGSQGLEGVIRGDRIIWPDGYWSR